MQVLVGALGRDFLRKLCSQQSLGSMVSLAFLASFKSCFLLKEKKNNPSAERSPGCGAQGAVGTYYSFISVPQALDNSFLGTGAVSQPYILSWLPQRQLARWKV